jgi:pyruvate dehydrogenase E1 component
LSGRRTSAAGAKRAGGPSAAVKVAVDPAKLACLKALERKILWLSAWTIHNANHLRPSRDGLKVGGHQASSASLVAIMTALYLDVLRPQDRVAVKPHASPVFHAIQYLLDNQDRERLENFRALGGAQSYPSRTKDADDVDFSTGSVGLGVAMTAFASLAQDYLRGRDALPARLAENRPGRMIALVGDAELDEGNIYECLLEGWKHDVRNLWWVIDYNRQSLDSVVTDRLFNRIDQLFENMGWRVVTLKYGKALEAVFRRPGGAALRRWIDECPNSLYSALVYQGGAAWRRQLMADIGGEAAVERLLAGFDDAALAELMTNLAGHDMESLLEAFHAIEDDQPTCFIAYTIKGHGLPFAGHKDNHAGLMNPEQMEQFRGEMAIAEGREWDPFEGLDLSAEELRAFLDQVRFNAWGKRRYDGEAAKIPMTPIPTPAGSRTSTQEAFGRILSDLAQSEDALAQRVVTASPDVTVSTGLGGWVNRRGIFDRTPREDIFRERKLVSAQRWGMSPQGQHIELGIAENNLFILLAALGLGHSLFGARLLPVGTLYDPFIARGLDALNYACYQDARFIVVGTPSGITLAPEGGAHQSIGTPLIGMAQDGLASFEPAYADELAVILEWAFDYLQRDGEGQSDTSWLRDMEGGSVYLRLTTRALDQPQRQLGPAERQGIIDGGYWLREPGPRAELAIVYVGALAAEALSAAESLAEDLPDLGILAVTSADRLNAGWHAAERVRESGRRDARSHIERLLGLLPADAGLVSVQDGHPANLEWLGSVRGQRVQSLGVEHFGQSGAIPDLYEHYRIDRDAIIDAAATLLLGRLG